MKNTVKYVSFILAMLLNATLLIGCDRHDKPEHETDTENLAQTDISTDEKVIDPDADSEGEHNASTSDDKSESVSDIPVDPVDAALAKHIVEGMKYEEAVALLGAEPVKDGGSERWFLSDGSILGVFLERGDSDDEMVINHAFIYSIVQTGEKCPQSIDEISSISLNAYGWMNLELDLEENESEIKKIIEYINEADETPTESTKGWYGGAYAVTIVKTNGEEYSFSLFSENMYSTSEYRTSDGYGAFVHQDVSEFFNYIKETFPDECFETEN